MEIDSYPEWIDEVRYSSVRCATELGSMPAPPSLKMRYISFISALEKLGDWLTPPLGELRLELRANTSGFDPGLYIFEINATNPPMYADNPAVTSSPCKWKGCLTWYSKSEPFVPVLYNPLTMVWTHDEQPVNMWQKQYDYRTSVKAHQISDPMYIAAIVNLTLDERLACGRDDRPLRRSAVVIGFALNNYVSRREEIMEIRAPIGWLFDSDCSVKTEATEVYPPPAERPTMIALVNNTPELPVHNWPSRARIIECRGDQHLAHVRIGAGLDRRRVYLFLIELKQNPANTPIANTWSLALGSESSGAMDGFPVWTFPGVRIEPVLLAWTNKTNPVSMPVAVFFETTNWLFYFEPPLTPLSKLAPILRIVMPSQYEFLVEAEDQDMQGERCFMSMQQEGSCRLCGVPFLPNEAWCIREWNRKNAAEVHFLPSKIIEPLNQYSIWVVVTNPHSPDAIDAPVSTWLMETFFGEPVPPAVAPFGYWLDYVVAPGYRVSGLSELTVETPEARDGGSFVDWVTFTMRFPDLLLPGDYIEIKAPPGYQLSYLQPGFQLVVLCYGFRWIPTIWPDPLPPDVDPETVPTHLLPIRPPERPPVPEGVPTWASGNSILEVKPTELTGALQWAADGAWVMRMPINFTAAILDDYNNFLELIDGNDSNFSNLTASDYVTPGGVELMRRIGLPDWAVPAAARSQLETMGNDTVNASTEYLVLRSHCLKQDAQDGGGNYLNDDFNWSKVPASADFQVFYDIKSWVYHNGSSVGVPETFNFTYFVLSKNLTEPNNVSNMTNESAGISYVDEIHLCFRALFPASRSEIDGLANSCVRVFEQHLILSLFIVGFGRRSARTRFTRLTASTELLVDGDTHSIDQIRQAISLLNERDSQVRTTLFAPPRRVENKRWSEFMKEPGIVFEPVLRSLDHTVEANDEAIEKTMRAFAAREDVRCLALLTSDNGFADLVEELQTSGVSTVVVIPERRRRALGRYSATNTTVLTVQPAHESDGPRVRAVLDTSGGGYVHLAGPYAPFDNDSVFATDVSQFLEGLGYRRPGDRFLLPACAKFWFANCLGSLTVFPFQLATISVHEMVQARDHYERYSGDLVFLLPVSSPSTTTKACIQTYGSRRARQVFRGGGPFILQDTPELSAQVLRRLGYLDDDLNDDLAEALFCFVNASLNKTQLRQLGLLPRPGARRLDVCNRLRAAFLSHDCTGQWQHIKRDGDSIRPILRILRKAKILGNSKYDKSEVLRAMNLYQKRCGLPRMQTFNGLAFRILWGLQTEPAKRNAESFCLQNCTGNATETECILDCLFTPIARNVTRCDTIPVGGLPEGAVNVAQELLPVPGCAAEVAAYEEALASGEPRGTAETTNMSNSSNSSNQTGMQNLTAPVCKCGLPTDVFMAVVWKSKVNLTKEVEDYRLEYEAAVRLRSLDTSPLQAPAECDGNKVTFNINAEDMHPDPQFVNSTVTFRFQMRFTNPRRPPLDYENNWIMLHSREVQLATAAESQNAILSSDAVQSWNVRSKLRYISIERLTEVLRPEDTAEIHFEFVTVNVADQLVIQAVSPPGFDFTSVYLSSEGTDDGQKPPNVGRRLLWQGFTSGITVQDGYRNECTLRVNFDKNEYVRFRLAGVRIPWTGGQALFTMYTTIVGQRQDEIELCCHAGEPPENPANVFQVPYRLQGLRGVLQSEWDQEAFNFPIASSMKTRLDEQHLVTFTFMVAENIILPPQANHMVIIVRAPVGYNILLLEDLMDVRDSSFLVEDLSATNGEGLRMRSLPFVLDLDESTGGKVQVSLPGLQSMSVDLEYRILFQAYTPSRHAVRVPNDLWVVEATDDYKLAQNQVAPQKGSLDDFELLSKVNFTVTTAAAPPEVVIVLEVTLFDLGEASEYPNRVDVYAPAGYKFLLNCFAPGERERLKKNLVSCRERWTLFNGNYLSGAILMAADNGVLPSDMPMTIKLLANTPPLTPERNYFFTVTKQREGDAGWGMTLDGFPVTPMPVTIRYTGVAGAEVPLFLALQVRYPLEWGGHIHIAAPLEYQIRCPISKVLLAPDDFRIPNCTHTDPVLNGCFGLPLVGSSDPNPLLPLCDPLHEILLTFEMPWWSTLDPEDFPTLEPIPRYALEGSTELLWSITVKVPDNTPKIRSNNVFRVRVMDANKVAVDGNLWLPGETVRTIPRVQDFKIWFTQPVPASMMTVAIHFTFNRTLPRGQESAPLRVIEIVAPEGIELKVRRPKDVQRLKSEDYVAVTEWNWTDILPRQLWFGLDPNQNVTGTFHYAFPALTPPDPPGMPYDNLWQVG
eukprot:symbB.v1.2.009122.t2/scaffold552.1/size189238/1